MALTQVNTDGVKDDAVTLAKQAAGTDGQVITYDASGNPKAIGPGTDGQVLTSAGAGAEPVFEDAVSEGTQVKSTGESGGTKFLREDGDGTSSWQTLPASGATLSGSTNNTVVTVTGADAMQGEANLTFDGTYLGAGVTPAANEGRIQAKTSDNIVAKFTRNNTGNYSGAIQFGNNDRLWSIYGSNSACAIKNITGSQIVLEADTSHNVKINAGNLVIGTSGKGIDFSATSDAGGSTSELLDDYEEGSWDPAWSNSTGTGPTGSHAHAGKYTKIGNIVHLTFSISADGNGLNGATGNIGISGVPFSAFSPNAQGIRGAFGVLGKGYGAPTDLRYCNLRSTNAIRLMLSDHTDVQEDSTGISWGYNCNQISGSLTYRIA